MGNTRSLSQRVRSVSSPESIDKARRDLGIRSGPARSTRRISPRDVLDRYSGDRAKSSGRTAPGARPTAPAGGRGVKGSSGDAIKVTDVRGPVKNDGKRPGQSGRPTVSDGPGKTGNRPTKIDRPIKTTPTKGRPDTKGPGGRPIAPGAGGGRPDATGKGSGQIQAERTKFARRMNQAVGGTNSGSNVASRPVDARPGVRPLGGVSHVGAPGTNGRFGRSWVNNYNSPYWYYNSCYWNTWGGLWGSNWGGWCGAPFYFTGYWWNNYWCNGGTWWPSSNIGFGFRSPWRSRFANLYFFGPLLNSSQTFVVYEDEEEEEEVYDEPEVIIVEVPEGSHVTVGDGQVFAQPAPAGRPLTPAAGPARGGPQTGGAQEGALDRELNRASAYYLTQGDRAFRETRFGDAVHSYAKAVEFAPESGILYLVLSDALFATGDYRYSAYALRQALDKEPDLALNIVDKRDFYANPTSFEEQLGTLERFVEDHALDVDARLVLTANYLFGGRPAEALALLESPLSEDLRSSPEGRLLKDSALRDLVAREAAGR